MHDRFRPRPAVLTASEIEASVARALAEDIGPGDVTAGLIPAGAACRAGVVTREQAVLCGTAWFDAVFHQLDPSVRIRWLARDGEDIGVGQTLCELDGPARPVLTGERTALNFLQTLSGTATRARELVAIVAGTGCRLLDTRKTLPGLRAAQKYAVRCGGASNHRQGLFDAILIKENHIVAAGSIAAAVAAARRRSPELRLEVEVESLEQLEEAIQAGADMLLLDNFTPEGLRAAVERNRKYDRPAILEASGGITEQNLRTIAETGVDYISVGAMTKNVRAVDFSMRFRLQPDPTS